MWFAWRSFVYRNAAHNSSKKAWSLLVELWTKTEEVETLPKCGVRNLRRGEIKGHFKAGVWQDADCRGKHPAFSVAQLQLCILYQHSPILKGNQTVKVNCIFSILRKETPPQNRLQDKCRCSKVLRFLQDIKCYLSHNLFQLLMVYSHMCF